MGDLDQSVVVGAEKHEMQACDAGDAGQRTAELAGHLDTFTTDVGCRVQTPDQILRQMHAGNLLQGIKGPMRHDERQAWQDEETPVEFGLPDQDHEALEGGQVGHDLALDEIGPGVGLLHEAPHRHFGWIAEGIDGGSEEGTWRIAAPLAGAVYASVLAQMRRLVEHEAGVHVEDLAHARAAPIGITGQAQEVVHAIGLLGQQFADEGGLGVIAAGGLGDRFAAEFFQFRRHPARRQGRGTGQVSRGVDGVEVRGQLRRLAPEQLPGTAAGSADLGGRRITTNDESRFQIRGASRCGRSWPAGQGRQGIARTRIGAGGGVE